MNSIPTSWQQLRWKSRPHRHANRVLKARVLLYWTWVCWTWFFFKWKPRLTNLISMLGEQPSTCLMWVQMVPFSLNFVHRRKWITVIFLNLCLFILYDLFFFCLYLVCLYLSILSFCLCVVSFFLTLTH